jgi:hypothetical protein
MDRCRRLPPNGKTHRFSWQFFDRLESWARELGNERTRPLLRMGRE